jgi:hypothetical protein
MDGAKELPQRGWVQPGEVVWCDVCARRTYVWELHHLIPMAWGGSESRLLTDHQVVWVRACGDCHGTIHMILDTARKGGGWPVSWLAAQDIPHLIVMAALRGWHGWKHQTLEGITT